MSKNEIKIGGVVQNVPVKYILKPNVDGAGCTQCLTKIDDTRRPADVGSVILLHLIEKPDALLVHEDSIDGKQLRHAVTLNAGDAVCEPGSKFFASQNRGLVGVFPLASGGGCTLDYSTSGTLAQFSQCTPVKHCELIFGGWQFKKN